MKLFVFPLRAAATPTTNTKKSHTDKKIRTTIVTVSIKAVGYHKKRTVLASMSLAG